MPNAFVAPYPHYEINLEDLSIFNQIGESILPLNRQLYLIKAQKGKVNEIDWYPDFSSAEKYFGAETFNMLNATYFSPASYFLNTIFKNNGAFIGRVADPSAKAAVAILEAHVKTLQVVQYEKVNGIRSVDANGDPIPMTTTVTEGEVTTHPAVTEPGLEIKWYIRYALDAAVVDGQGQITTAAETIDGLQVKAVGTAPNIVTTYPIFAIEANSVGIHGNDSGFSLFYDNAANDMDMVDRVDGIFYSFAPVQKDYNKSTATGIRDMYRNLSTSFIMKPNVVDPATTAAVSFAEILTKSYTADFPLPFKVYQYPANISTIGALAAALEPSIYPDDSDDTRDELSSGWRVNIVSGLDLHNRPYDHIVVAYDTIQLNENAIIYLKNGTDGATDETTIQGQIVSMLQGDLNPQIIDKAQYPFTHLYDPGYKLDTKYAMLGFLNLRDDVKVEVATQDYTLPRNTQAQDEAMLASLRAHALLMRESIVKGTACCRASIYMHCGDTLDTYTQYLPMTLFAAAKHAEYQNTDHLQNAIAGLPNSAVTILKNLNWTAFAEDTQSRNWNAGGNYVQFYDRNKLHIASVRTVYPYDTSVLVNDLFVDAIVYSKHAIRVSWATHAGLEEEFAILSDMITKDLTNRLSTIFNGKYKFTVTVYQTEFEAQLGFVSHVRVEIIAPATNRVWAVDIVCKRENFGA